MTRADLVEAVCERTGLSRRNAAGVVDAMLAVVKEALRTGETVKITGFGTWRVRQKGERAGRNPQTGQAIVIRPRRVVAFKPSWLLRGLVSHPTASRPNGPIEQIQFHLLNEP